MNQLLRLLFAGLLMVGITACERDQGPAEQAGEQVDQAMEEASEAAGQAVEEAGEAVEQAGDRAREQTEQ